MSHQHSSKDERRPSHHLLLFLLLQLSSHQKHFPSFLAHKKIREFSPKPAWLRRERKNISWGRRRRQRNIFHLHIRHSASKYSTAYFSPSVENVGNARACVIRSIFLGGLPPADIMTKYAHTTRYINHMRTQGEPFYHKMCLKSVYVSCKVAHFLRPKWCTNIADLFVTLHSFSLCAMGILERSRFT